MERQLDDLRRLGLTWDGPVVLQSHRLPLYHKAIDQLRERDLTYPCFCTRKEILQAPSAPHAPDGATPARVGTFRRPNAPRNRQVADLPR